MGPPLWDNYEAGFLSLFSEKVAQAVHLFLFPYLCGRFIIHQCIPIWSQGSANGSSRAFCLPDLGSSPTEAAVHPEAEPALLLEDYTACQDCRRVSEALDVSF